MTVRAAVEKLDGVTEVEASHRDERVEVAFDPDRTSVAQIERAIEEAGYAAEIAAGDSAGDTLERAGG
ncbi:MAG: heavy-metal-associated domain-containing protein [Thermoanaerobaculia bacterium]